MEEVVVLGTRAIIQNSIQLKRNSIEIVDGLNADEIGDLPALSIGEAMETITGAATHRENGGATEVAVRGLGPYLGTTVVNYRESTNGSGNRAVNFSIFPSEMFIRLPFIRPSLRAILKALSAVRFIWIPGDRSNTAINAYNSL